MKQWGARHDFTLGEGRLFSYSTGVQDDGTEEMLITGYGAPSRRQHPYFQRKGDETSAHSKRRRDLRLAA